MGRHSTSGIKQRKQTTVYLTDALDTAVRLAYIEVQQKLRGQVDRTLFNDALMEAGLNHPEEIRNRLIQRVRRRS